MYRLKQMWRFFCGIPLPWWIAVWTVVLIIAAGAVWVMCPAWLTGGESASTTLRNLGLILGAAIGLPIAIWRSIVAERQAEAAHRQSDSAMQILLNDRFQKAAEMLGNPDVESVRIGGIHALARLANEYPGSFHIPVMQLFSAFVVDRTRVHAAERIEPVDCLATPGVDEKRELESGNDVRDEKAVDQDDTQRFESASENSQSPYFWFRIADRDVGPIHELARDVKEVMGQIAERSEGQISVENEEEFRMNLVDACLPGLIFHGADFSNFDFTMADLRRIRGWEACFTNAVLPGADLSAGNLHGANFSSADTRRVNLTAARLMSANFRNADLGLVDKVGQNLWKGTRFPTRLRGAQLQAADLRGANFCGADMRGADMYGADIRETDMRGANLHRTSLLSAKLNDADFGGAELTLANLAGAHLGNANLADAIVSGTDFARDWRSGIASPARGLTQQQLDQAKADPASPPILDGVIDPESNKPLVWNGHVV